MKGVHLNYEQARSEFLNSNNIKCNYCRCYLDQYTLVLRSDKKGKFFPACYDCREYISTYGRPPVIRRDLPDKNYRGKVIFWEKSVKTKKTKKKKSRPAIDKTGFDFSDLRCNYCNCFLDMNTVTIDHIIPKSLSNYSPDDADNMVPACWQCNHDKGDKFFFKPEKKDLPTKTKNGKIIYW